MTEITSVTLSTEVKRCLATRPQNGAKASPPTLKTRRPSLRPKTGVSEKRKRRYGERQTDSEEEERINRGLPPSKEKRKRTWLGNYLVAMSFSLLSEVFFQKRDQLLTHFEKAFIFYNTVDIWAFRIFFIIVIITGNIQS